jgi:superfamily II DNA or RNA helicase
MGSSPDQAISSVQGPQGFRKLGLRYHYNTANHDLAREFFIPLLSHAISYDRGVGYFSSGWLRANAQGLAGLAMRGGRARWVTSPLLSQEDIEAFSKIAELEEVPNCLYSLVQTVDELKTALEKDTRNTMAWMVADGLLEFRFAIPVGELIGDFHDKFGIFRDEYGQRVSFLGSYNETVKGLRNYESIRVFFSWEASTAEAVAEDEQRFARIWLGCEHNLRVFQLPEAIRKGILELRTDDRPYPKPKIQFDVKSTISLPGVFPRPYQEEAIEAWEKNGRRGILDMATGTGKTVVALTAITHCADVGFIVIGAPTNPLVTQWLRELDKLEGIHSPIEISGNNPKWSEELLPRLRLGTTGGTRGRPFVFVGTYKSLSGDRFHSILGEIVPADKLGLIIADEVHNLGAPTYQRLLCSHFSYRLGLTATLERAYDDKGTQTIADYFEGVVYKLGIDKTVGSILCQYRYDVHFVELDEDEFAEYQRLSVQVASLMGKPTGTDSREAIPSQSDKASTLLNQRARIVKLARAKLDLLATLVGQIPISKCLIYCADIEQLRAVQRILANASISHLPYTSEESSFAKRTALDQLRRNDTQAVVAVKCLDEGIDVPQVHQAILLASSTSEREFVQRRGRILRRAEGKRYAHLIDIFAIPPRRYHQDPPTLLFNELKRAKILAKAADNRFEVENKLFQELSNFGIPIEQTLGD